MGYLNRFVIITRKLDLIRMYNMHAGTLRFKRSLKLTVLADKLINFINTDEKNFLSLHFELLQKLKQLNLIFLIIHLM